MVEMEDTRLHEAVRLGDPDLVELALEHGLDPDAVGLYQWCPLHEAASNGDIKVVELLLQHKADPNKPDNLHSSTPLHYAAKEGHADCLKVLIKAGGWFDIQNTDGDSPMDLANGQCSDILDRERTKQFIELSLTDARKVIHRSRSKEFISDVNSLDFTDTFNRTLAGRSTPTAWDNIEVIEQGKAKSGKTGTGLLQCSFEYNSKSRGFKIRVWQVEEVLMPPAEFSSISRIYVKSHLLPDKKGESKRRTDEIKVEDSSKMQSSFITLKRKSALEGFKAIYLPSTFKFSKALVYKDIEKVILPSKMVHLDVCVRLKYSTKSLPIASFQISLKEAVRKLRKEKFRLLPCINYSAPDNVHTTDPNDFIVVMEGLYTNRTLSNPMLRKENASKTAQHKKRASSEIALQSVRCHSVESIPTVSVSLSSEEDIGNEAEDLTEVKCDGTMVTSENGDNLHYRMTVVDVHNEDPLLPGSTEDVVTDINVKSYKSKPKTSTLVDLGGSVLETSFVKDLGGRRSVEESNDAVIPKIIVTSPDGVTARGESVAIEMRHLMRQKMKEKQEAGKRKATKMNIRRNKTFNAKPGHVVDLRTTEVKKNSREHQTWAISSSHVIKNKAYDQNDVENDLRGWKPERETVRGINRRRDDSIMRGDDQGGQKPAPDITCSFISEEKPKERRSPTTSPRTSPARRSPSSERSQNRSQSPSVRSSSNGSPVLTRVPVPRRVKKDISSVTSTGSNPKHIHHANRNLKMEYVDESNERNKLVTTPGRTDSKSQVSHAVSDFVYDIDETSPKERPSPSRKSKFVHVRLLPSDIPPSPLVVKEVSEIDFNKSKTTGNLRLKRPSVRRAVDFGITPPLTKGIKTTDLVSSNIAIDKLKAEQIKINLSHLQNDISEED